LGIALLGSVLTAIYQADLRRALTGVDPALVEAARQSPGAAYESAAEAPDAVVTVVLDAVALAFGHALSITVLIGAVVLVIGAVLSWRLLPGHGGDLAEFTPDHGEQP
jgi:DHA2 family multidrug resistance protein-like MFS transporter